MTGHDSTARPGGPCTVAEPADLEGLVGKELGTSDWRTVDQETIDAFARLTRDEQWIHVDRERAAAGAYGTTIAHGFLTLSLCTDLLEQTLVVERLGASVNYGLDRVRFPAPVPSGARVRGRAELRSFHAIDGGAQVVIGMTVEIEGGVKPACVAELVFRYLA